MHSVTHPNHHNDDAAFQAEVNAYVQGLPHTRNWFWHELLKTVGNPGHERVVHELIRRHVIPARYRDPGTQYSMLHYEMSPATARALIAAGADVHARARRTGRTPLHHAAARPGDHVAMAEALLAGGARVSNVNAKGHQALYGASGSMTNLLLRAGADPRYAHPTTGSTALHASARGRRPTATSLLLRAGADPSALERRVPSAMSGNPVTHSLPEQLVGGDVRHRALFRAARERGIAEAMRVRGFPGAIPRSRMEG